VDLRECDPGLRPKSLGAAPVMDCVKQSGPVLRLPLQISCLHAVSAPRRPPFFSNPHTLPFSRMVRLPRVFAWRSSVGAHDNDAACAPLVPATVSAFTPLSHGRA
jgi:hypothetical protein